jgi:flagellar basal body P-ring formation protein FlgA
VGMRCTSGPTRWNVFMPVTVRVLAPAVQARQALSAGTQLGVEHLQVAEVDWAAADSPAFARTDALLGRTLSQGLAAGAAVRESDLKRRQWFAIGDVVRVTAVGRGFQVGAEGIALTPGIEGQAARVRTESGRTLTGIVTADKRVEIQL